MSNAETLLKRLEAETGAIDPKAADVKDRLRLLDGLLSEVETFVSTLDNVQTREEVARAKAKLSQRLETLRQLS